MKLTKKEILAQLNDLKNTLDSLITDIKAIKEETNISDGSDSLVHNTIEPTAIWCGTPACGISMFEWTRDLANILKTEYWKNFYSARVDCIVVPNQVKDLFICPESALSKSCIWCGSYSAVDGPVEGTLYGEFIIDSEHHIPVRVNLGSRDDDFDIVLYGRPYASSIEQVARIRVIFRSLELR